MISLYEKKAQNPAPSVCFSQQQPLASSAINSLNCNFIGVGSGILIAFGNSCVKLFHHGLELCLVGTILGAQLFGLFISFCRRFNIGHVLVAPPPKKLRNYIAFRDYSKIHTKKQAFFYYFPYFFLLYSSEFRYTTSCIFSYVSRETIAFGKRYLSLFLCFT